MKRVEEKVKDIVDVRPFKHVHDFSADPARTLEGYHFTDITASLMATWIERAINCKAGSGVASALAGFRGVGKSHFLSAFAAILSHPELRSRIADELVSSVSVRLLRRSYHVVFVRRGSASSLLEELKTAVSGALGIPPSDLDDSPKAILQKASQKTGDLPLVLLFDTELGREFRVSRDDGPLLSEIGLAAKEFGVFTGVALDDDISGADGPNSAISANFGIDYLDPEHLFKIVDTHIFSKNSQKQALLREIYGNFRSVLPGFRWSEPRFTALYPLHPATLEIAPLIRLYIQDFALLDFASEAGVKILGRPANSLIGLDEMFDNVETKLRSLLGLKQAFAVFDKLEHGIIAKAPVQARLHAKLILKGLFLLSLDGQGATVEDIAAGMMIIDEGPTTVNIDGWLTAFNGSFPETITKNPNDRKYCFRLSDKDDINNILDDAAAAVTEDAIWSVLLKQAAEKFTDVPPTADFGTRPTPVRVEWRGSIRSGSVIWDADGLQNQSAADLDWQIRVERRAEIDAPESDDLCPLLLWRVAIPTEDEKNIVRRFHVLQTDTKLRGQFHNSFGTAMQIHSIALERIWQRLFINDAYVSHGDQVYTFSDDIGRSGSLAQILSSVLDQCFAGAYPLHPEFLSPLTEDKTSHLISNFFGGRARESNESQAYAEVFAMPLGLAVKDGEMLAPATTDTLANLDYVRNLLESEWDESKILPLNSISALFRSAPFGLTRESQHLVLASLVSQRQFEFVTNSGNRINHRSLDLQVLWGDIEGIARPKSDTFSEDKLLFWARRLTGHEDLRSLEADEDRQRIDDALKEWLREWRHENTLAKFDMLHDECLNTTVWRTAMGLKRSFANASTIIESRIEDKISLEDCFRQIANLFSDSEDEYEREKSELARLANHIVLSERRQAASYYVSASEWTGVAAIDDVRRELLMLLANGSIDFKLENDGSAGLWKQFQELYSSHYVEKHAAAMSVFASGQTLKDMMASEMWSTFQVITELPLIDRRFAEQATSLIREIRGAVCSANVGEQLLARPVCTCANLLDDLEKLTQLPDELRNVVNRAMESFKKLMLDNKETVIRVGKDKFPNSSIQVLLDSFDKGDEFPVLSAADLRLLKIVCADLPIQAEIMMEHIPGADVVEEVIAVDPASWVAEGVADSALLDVN